VLASLQFNADRDRPVCCFDFDGSKVSKWPVAARCTSRSADGQVTTIAVGGERQLAAV
jgi:hypothetical protein